VKLARNRSLYVEKDTIPSHIYPMAATLNFHIPLSIDELADLIKAHLPAQERLKLAQLLKGEPGSIEEDDDEPTKEQLIEEIKQAVREVNLVKKGKMKSRPVEELLDEL
jgi:hypothetical protein